MPIRKFDDIGEEFYQAHQAGISYSDWRQMTRWQVMDFLARTVVHRKRRADKLRNAGWKKVLGAVVARILGIG